MSDNDEERWVAELPQDPFDLSEELARWRKLRLVAVPADVVSRMDRATSELAASSTIRNVLPVGSQAPAFALPNAMGEEVSLAHMLASGPVVLSFYRGSWCPFCNLELRALQQALPQIIARGASLAAISGMTPDKSASLSERHDLTYEVLSDFGLLTARAYGLVFDLPDYLRESYARMNHPIPQFNGTPQHALPIRGTFVVDTAGVIRFAYANADYMYRADPDDILTALDKV